MILKQENDWQNKFIQVLNEDFKALKQKNSKFSVRAYARRLGLSPGSLSDIMKGTKNWNLSPKRAATLLDKMNVKSSMRNRLLVMMGEPPKHVRKALAESDYDVLLDWTYYAILASFDLSPEYTAPERLVSRFGLTSAKVESVLSELLRRGLLIKSPEGQLKRPEVLLETADNIPNEVIKAHHEKNIELGLKALHELPPPKRDFTSLTFAGNSKQIAELRAEIRRLYEKASSLMSSESEHDGVFRLSVQLFPLEFGENE